MEASKPKKQDTTTWREVAREFDRLVMVLRKGKE